MLVACIKIFILPKLIRSRETFWTAPSLRTRDKTLLRIICNICSKDWEDLSSSAIAAKYVNARLAGVDEWTKHVPHAVVIKLPFCVSAILLLSEEVVERCCWKIAKQDRPAKRRFPTHVFGDVTDAEVHGPCGFVASELR